MQIEFTKQQYETLMKMAYFGEWLANAHRIDDRIKKYDELLSHIFSYAKEFGFDKYVDDEEADRNVFYPTRDFEENTEVDKLREEYDEETFWEELIDRLGHRDFFNNYTKDEIKKMDQKERFIKLHEHIDKWGEEMEKHGIDRLEIKD